MRKYMISNIYEATTYILDLLKQNGWRIHSVQPQHFERHRLITIFKDISYPTAVRIKRKYIKIYLVYQRNLLEEFDKLYGTTGMGKAVGINLSILEWAQKGADLLVFITKDGLIFSINPKKYLKLVRENNWTRVTERSEELVANLPIKYLEIL